MAYGNAASQCSTLTHPLFCRTVPDPEGNLPKIVDSETQLLEANAENPASIRSDLINIPKLWPIKTTYAGPVVG